jgi:quinoprotein glucose dehydrogenase
VPQPGEPNFGTWGPDGWQDRRGPGSWVNMTVDVANGLVFVPMGQPTDQNFGNSRPGTNLYSSSLLALDAATGKLKWHFQMTHHDIYDWDANAPPTLIDVTRNGEKIPALAQSTKQGLMFILNRLTGEAIFGVEERPVPPLDAPGDQTWPTQPFPVKPAPISRTSMTRDEVNKTSPASEKVCKALYDTMVQSGPYTPTAWCQASCFQARRAEAAGRALHSIPSGD